MIYMLILILMFDSDYFGCVIGQALVFHMDQTVLVEK
jgi:hypothetical protein